MWAEVRSGCNTRAGDRLRCIRLNRGAAVAVANAWQLQQAPIGSAVVDRYNLRNQKGLCFSWRCNSRTPLCVCVM